MPPGEVKDPQTNEGNGPKTGYLYRYDRKDRSVIPVLNAQNLQFGQFVVFRIEYPVIDQETGTRIPIAVIPEGFESDSWDKHPEVRKQWDDDWKNAVDMTSQDAAKRDQSRK